GGGVQGALAWARKRREEHRDRQIGAAALEQREHAVEAAREIDDEREPVIVVPSVFEVPKSERVVKERQKPLFQDLPDSPLPPLVLLEDAPSGHEQISAETLEFTSRLIERKLADFGVVVNGLAAYPGQVSTRFETR